MLKEVKDQKVWNELVLKNPPRSGGFLGSWEWGAFQEAVGRKALRFVDEGGAYAQVIQHELPFGKKYWFAPRRSMIAGLGDEAKRQGVLFVRFEPLSLGEVLKGAKKTIHVSPPATLIVDLTNSEDALLSGMHEKTRYNIRLAARKSVKCPAFAKATAGRQVSSVKGFEDFWNLLQETAKRDGFRTHPRVYYEKMLEVPFVELWTATWEEKTLAAGLWSFFGDTATYLHGASSGDHRNVMAPHLLHWEVIRSAKSRGMKVYDFWGIEPKTSNLKPKTSWGGMTRFKIGFGGEVVEYPGTYDLPISTFGYTLYKIVRKMRRI